MSDELDDEEQLYRTLQEHVREMEKRELAQMRQSAILQRKLEGAEKELNEQNRLRELRQQDSKQKLLAQHEAQSSECLRKSAQEIQALEQDLQGKLTASRRHVERLEQNITSARTDSKKLEKDSCFWRQCGQELLHEAEREDLSKNDPSNSALNHGASDGHNQSSALHQLRAHLDQRAAELEALRVSCSSLEDQLPELRKMAECARAQEMQLRRRNAELEAATSHAEMVAKDARSNADKAWQKAHAASQEADIIQERLEQERELVTQLAGRGRSEEASQLHRQIQNLHDRVAKLQQEKSRISAALHHHAGPEVQSGERAHADSSEASILGKFDETVTWIATQLFKSILVRRLFCIHVALLYSWLLFLLWWMSPTGRI